MTTAGLDRALTALSTELSFGAAAAQMLEQHGHEVDRTLVEPMSLGSGPVTRAARVWPSVAVADIATPPSPDQLIVRWR